MRKRQCSVMQVCLFGLVAAAAFSAGTGCSTQDSQRAVIDPTYSYVRAGEPAVSIFRYEQADARNARHILTGKMPVH